MTRCELARLLGCSRNALYYQQVAGHIPPMPRSGYTPKQVAKIRAWWPGRRSSQMSWYTDADVAEMRRLWAGGLQQAEIAEMYGTSQPHVSRLLGGITRAR